jgi:hypothetical protein
MTTIIISVLCALGIGGGVMIASSGGGGGGGGSAAVGPVTPGGSGSGGSIQAGKLLKSVSSSKIRTITEGSQVDMLKNGKNISLTLSAYAPLKVGKNSYQTNDIFETAGSRKYVWGFTQTTPPVKVTFDLGTIQSSSAVADFYVGNTVTQYLGTLSTTSLRQKSSMLNFVNENVTWTLTSNLALGGRLLGLENSDFGYYTWLSRYTNSSMESSSDSKRYRRYSSGQFYMFDTSKQLMASQYDRYSATSNIASFSGKAIGAVNYLNNNCGGNAATNNLSGDITLSLNFNNKQLSGNITNTKLGNYTWYNIALTGTINNEITNNSPNFAITNLVLSGTVSALPIENNVVYKLGMNNYGSGAVVKGSSVSKDEVVGEIAFTGHNTTLAGGNLFVNTHIGFGAKKSN